MDEYIDKEAFIEDIKTEILNLSMDGLKGTRMPHDELYQFIERIKEQPAADVVEVVHARWNIILSCDNWKIKCPNCGRVFDRFINGAILPEHCFCGAKMDMDLEESK